jgi:hypothetical protein
MTLDTNKRFKITGTSDISQELVYLQQINEISNELRDELIIKYNDLIKILSNTITALEIEIDYIILKKICLYIFWNLWDIDNPNIKSPNPWISSLIEQFRDERIVSKEFTDICVTQYLCELCKIKTNYEEGNSWVGSKFNEGEIQLYQTVLKSYYNCSTNMNSISIIKDIFIVSLCHGLSFAQDITKVFEYINNPPSLDNNYFKSLSSNIDEFIVSSDTIIMNPILTNKAYKILADADLIIADVLIDFKVSKKQIGTALTDFSQLILYAHLYLTNTNNKINTIMIWNPLYNVKHQIKIDDFNHNELKDIITSYNIGGNLHQLGTNTLDDIQNRSESSALRPQRLDTVRINSVPSPISSQVPSLRNTHIKVKSKKFF